MTKNLKFIIPVTVIFVVMVLVKLFTPEPTDWNPSYSKNDKIPYGSFLLYEILPDLFTGRNIETTNLPFYNITRERRIENKNVIIICNGFEPDEPFKSREPELSATHNRFFKDIYKLFFLWWF